MNTLSEKVVLITGAGRGIGAGTARALHRRGAKLILTDLDAPPLAELVAELGDDVLSVAADVCDLPSMERAVAAGVERFGGIDLVLANAGIASYGSVLAVDPATFKRVLDVNLLGVFHTVRAALPAVIERRGYILIVSSEAAFAPAPGLVAYNASKAGVEHLASALRLEVAHHGVAVGSAHMSWIDTPLVRDAKDDLAAFRQLLERLPAPLGKTTSLEACVKAFVAGLEHRKRRVYVPGWVRLIGWLKPVITSPLGERESLKQAPTLLPQMDAEVAALGRSTSARNVAMDDALTEANR
ncbi:MAG TPA: SDR family oxidoreductase [Solirubrobacteraceae bacterium]|jgi:NAD(P)-dependent dehydrogenase (short-subunit alcohol dehydrogenase family)|nr:SDR family oxidoreductase [Solirubrobacteraceae bacterium]